MIALSRILIVLSFGLASAAAVYFGRTLDAGAFVEPTEFRLLGEPVHGRLVRDAFGNTVGFEAFSEEPLSSAGVLALNGE
jgi:hypothetical protein